MSCSGVLYASGRLIANGARFRLLPLAKGQREAAAMTLTTAAAVAVGGDTITLASGLTKPVFAGDVLTFDKGLPGEGTVTLADGADVAATELQIVPAVAVIASGATAQTIGSVYVAGVTALQISSQPNAIESQDLLSEGFTETTITGDTISFPITVERVSNCPGQGILADLAYNPKLKGREVFAQLIFEDGETYEGATIVTSTSQDANPNAIRTMQLTLNVQGCSFRFVHQTGFEPLEFPEI